LVQTRGSLAAPPGGKSTMLYLAAGPPILATGWTTFGQQQIIVD